MCLIEYLEYSDYLNRPEERWWSRDDLRIAASDPNRRAAPNAPSEITSRRHVTWHACTPTMTHVDRAFWHTQPECISAGPVGRSDFFCYALETGAKVAADNESGANEPRRDSFFFFTDESPPIARIPGQSPPPTNRSFRASYRR